VIGRPAGIQLFIRDTAGPASRDYLVSDNVLADLARGIVLERSAGVRIRGNTFDGVGEGIVADSAARDAQVTGNLFLRAQRWFISAPELTAGSNYWATRTAEEARARVNGRITVVPWFPASALGY
jgi:parallel beta-helix repeat protein